MPAKGSSKAASVIPPKAGKALPAGKAAADKRQRLDDGWENSTEVSDASNALQGAAANVIETIGESASGAIASVVQSYQKNLDDLKDHHDKNMKAMTDLQAGAIEDFKKAFDENHKKLVEASESTIKTVEEIKTVESSLEKRAKEHQERQQSFMDELDVKVQKFLDEIKSERQSFFDAAKTEKDSFVDAANSGRQSFIDEAKAEKKSFVDEVKAAQKSFADRFKDEMADVLQRCAELVQDPNWRTLRDIESSVRQIRQTQEAQVISVRSQFSDISVAVEALRTAMDGDFETLGEWLNNFFVDRAE